MLSSAKFPKMRVKFVLALLVSFLILSCGLKPKKKKMKVGDKITVQPSLDLMMMKSEGKDNVHVIFDLGGKSLKYTDKTVIEGYESFQAKTPIFSWDAKDLEEAYRHTKCDSSMIKVLESAVVGDALFCNKSMDVSKIKYWVAKREGKRSKTSTSFITNEIDDERNLISITVSFR